MQRARCMYIKLKKWATYLTGKCILAVVLWISLKNSRWEKQVLENQKEAFIFVWILKNRVDVYTISSSLSSRNENLSVMKKWSRTETYGRSLFGRFQFSLPVTDLPFGSIPCSHYPGKGLKR